MFDQTHHATRNLERALTSDMTARFCPARRLWSAALMLGAPILVPVAGAAAGRRASGLMQRKSPRRPAA